MAADHYDFAVVGAGIVGLATARELQRRHPGASVAVLERASRIATGQTGANSGVLHAGIYYAPGSLKARLCVEGAARMYDFCDEHGIPAQRIGKVIVATDETELPGLAELERRGAANGVPGLRRLDARELRELEPHVTGVAALHSPNTGIVDFGAVAQALATEVQREGGTVLAGHAVERVDARADALVLANSQRRCSAGLVVFCAGGDADRLAVMCGAPADPRIVPFRGAYLKLAPAKRHLVRSLIYPVPDPRLPFLGVHLTPTIKGEVVLGPTALLAPQRMTSSLTWPGTWRMFRRFWRTGAHELHMAASRATVAAEARRYVPAIETGDLSRAFAGVRAQALARDGTLVDDFVVHHTERAIHVRNAPSPAATSSLALAALIADQLAHAGRA